MLPEPRLIEAIARHSPIVEIGAGTGYWAYLLRLSGADVIAYDAAPPGGTVTNRYHPDVRPWSQVVNGDATVLAAHGSRSLFLCWPPRYSSLWESLRFYRGPFILHIGDRGRTTARIAGLEERYELMELHPATAMDARSQAELRIWRRVAS